MASPELDSDDVAYGGGQLGIMPQSTAHPSLPRYIDNMMPCDTGFTRTFPNTRP